MTTTTKNKDKAKNVAKMVIRPMMKRDINDVVHIEENSMEHPWKPRDFQKAISAASGYGIVAEVEGQVEGFVVCITTAGRVELLALAVDDVYRRLGVATALIRNILTHLNQQNPSSAEIMIRELNLPSQLFFKSVGFRAVKVVKGYYTDTEEPGYLFRYRLGDAPVPQSVSTNGNRFGSTAKAAK